MRILSFVLALILPTVALAAPVVDTSPPIYLRASKSQIESGKWSLDRAFQYIADSEFKFDCFDFNHQKPLQIEIASSPGSIDAAIESVRGRIEGIFGKDKSIFVAKYREAYWFTQAAYDQQRQEIPAWISGAVLLPGSTKVLCWSNW